MGFVVQTMALIVLRAVASKTRGYPKLMKKATKSGRVFLECSIVGSISERWLLIMMGFVGLTMDLAVLPVANSWSKKADSLSSSYVRI